MLALKLRSDAVGPIARGHPWVYRDGLVGAAEPGQVVALEDRRGRLVTFGLADSGEIAVRVLGRRPVDLRALVEQRIETAQHLRETVVESDTDVYRLVNGAGDGLPGVVVDRYGKVALLRLYSKAWESHLDLLLEALSRLGWCSSVLRRMGVKKVDSGEGVLRLHGPAVPGALVVKENGLSFLVRPATGQKTGFYIDQRENRLWVGRVGAGLGVLNLFGYSGAFSVYAAAGGARRTVTVDQAAPALEDARENFKLNGMDPSEHDFVEADVFRWTTGERFQLVICDPPSLSRSAHSDGAARRAYRELNAHVAPMVATGGLLFTASCTARLSEDRWFQAMRQGLSRVDRGWSIVRRSHEPPDHPVALWHPEGRYLKAVALRRGG